MILKYNDEYGSSRGNALYSGNLPPTASAVGGKLRYRVALASLAENEILVIKFGPPRNMENESLRRYEHKAVINDISESCQVISQIL